MNMQNLLPTLSLNSTTTWQKFAWDYDFKDAEENKLALRLDDFESTLHYQDSFVHLRPKLFQLAEIFLKQPNTLISKETLIELLWQKNTHYGESGLNHAIFHLRKALKELGLNRQLIQTVPKRGYRFVWQNKE